MFVRPANTGVSSRTGTEEVNLWVKSNNPWSPIKNTEGCCPSKGQEQISGKKEVSPDAFPTILTSS